MRTLRLLWTVLPLSTPQPWIACSRCNAVRPFRSSERIRLNANGKRLDAWLVYRCTTCDQTWNRPLFERRAVHDLDRETLQALQSNDAAWIRRQAFDLDALARRASRIDEADAVTVDRHVIGAVQDGWTILAIELHVPLPARLRFDRLLAAELHVSRSLVRHLYDGGGLRIEPDRRDGLRRRIADGARIVIDTAHTALPPQVRQAITTLATHGWIAASGIGRACRHRLTRSRHP